MFDYDNAIFQPCKEWIADALNAGKSWDDILTLCVSSEERESKLADLIDEFMWPEDLTLDAWEAFVADYKTTHITVTMAEGEPVIAIDNGITRNHYPVPYGITSSWEQYKAYLKTTMSEVSVSNIQKSCTWILNHLSSDTRKAGAIKGLVTGSVQSGKTANMEGLVSMAADYDWNFFIILSGTIDNLRKQTRDRFKKDLRNSEGILWRILDFTGEDKQFGAEELKLNPLTGSKNYSQRYVTVCLKNRKRLEKLIDWLYDDPNRTSKLRILVIDDEADQASINTAEITQEEEQERCAINQLICNLVNGKKSDGVIPEVRVQAINYISFTATPYANVLNESSVESLYPKDFICTLPEATEYFGAKVIFGNNEQECPGFPILREVNSSENKLLKEIQKKKKTGLPDSMKQAISWFLCATSVLRVRGHKKSISMLVHTSSIQKEHFVIYDEIQNWLADKSKVIDYCREVYTKEAHTITKADLQEANPDYGLLSSVRDDMPTFEELLGELNDLLSGITNILLGEDKSLEYTSGLHLCVDNCSANREAEEGTYLRIVYPTDEQLKSMEKAPAFLVIGGNTLSRGLTIDGLVCTFFSRTSNQADTLMQMARWFGYRKGYELLQRIWITDDALRKFKALAKIDMDLKHEVEMFMERGISPSKFGPRIRNTPEIAKFRITAKKKSQMAEYADFDFCGDSYETTDFTNDDSLIHNLALTDQFIAFLDAMKQPRSSTAAKAFVWDSISYEDVLSRYLSAFEISDYSTSLKNNLRYFFEWMSQMNSEGKFTKWNVAVIDGDNQDNLWSVGDGLYVGMIERTRKKVESEEYIDIGSLRSGRDAVCDVNESELTPEQLEEFKKTRKNGKNIISKRCDFGLQDKPLLLIYRIKKDGGEPKTKNRLKMNAIDDIIGISIIVSGDSIGETHAKSLRIMI